MDGVSCASLMHISTRTFAFFFFFSFFFGIKKKKKSRARRCGEHFAATGSWNGSGAACGVY